METMNNTIPAVLPPDVSEEPLFDAGLTIGWLLASTAVCLRIFFRIKTKNRLWVDDWLIIAAEVVITAAFLVCMIVLRRALGHHIYYLNESSLPEFFKSYVFAELSYSFVIGLVKLSVLAFYWRIFSTALRIRVLVILLAILVFSWMMCLTFIVIFQCHPIEGVWNPLLPGRVCISYQKFYLGSAIPNIFTDFMMVVMPIHYVSRLQMRMDQRVGLIGTFILGGFVIIVSIIRIITVLKQDYNSVDFTWDMYPVVMWTGVEMFTAIICACLPSMKPILNFLRTRHLFPPRSSGDQPSGHHRGPSFTFLNRRQRRGPYTITGWTDARTEIDSEREGSMTHMINLAKYDDGDMARHEDRNPSPLDCEGSPVPLKELPGISSHHQPET